MKTTITNIKKQENFKNNEKYFVLYFEYFGEERFTYLTKKGINYFKSKGLNKLSVGLNINVIAISDKHFKIIGLGNV